MNNLFSEGYLAAERFVVFQNLAKNQNLKKDIFTRELQSRHLEDWFFKDADKEIERLESKEVKEWEDHLYLFQLHRRVYHHPNQSLRMKPANHSLEKMSAPIDLVYLLEKATIINEKIFRNRLIKGENHDITLDLKKWLPLTEDIENPAIKLYKMRFEYTEENMLEKYFELRKYFLEEYEKLNEKEQKIHFFSLSNDTSKLIRTGNIEITEILPLYKLGLKSEIILNEGTLKYTTFVSMVAVSNTKKNFEFTKIIIQNYTGKLDSNAQQDGLFWAKAHTHYYQKNLNECLEILLNHEFKLFDFQKITRILTTQVYFDLHLKDISYQSFLFNYFDSFEKWLSREKFQSQNIKKSYLRFVQVTRTLAKSFGENDFNIEKVQNLLQEEGNIQASEWLSKRIKRVIEIKKKRSL